MTQITTGIDQPPVLETSLEMPYTLTTGKAVSVFIEHLSRQVIAGSRCASCERTVVPAQDYCTRCGSEQKTLVSVPQTGTVTAITRTVDGAVALIRLDGVDADLMHQVDESAGEMAIGDRVEAVWAPEPVGTILNLAHFAPSSAAVSTEANGNLAEVAEEDLVGQIVYSLSLPYRHSYGPNYGRLFDELGARSGLIGSRCTQCRNVLVPPRSYCEICYVKTEQFVGLKDTGRLQAFSVIHMEFVGQTRKPPYVYAEIVLDGASTRLIHNLAGVDMTTAQETLEIGMPVRAVWKPEDQRNGTLDDIDYFEPVNGGVKLGGLDGRDQRA
jgi:uncharacterized OB-fold protein